MVKQIQGLRKRTGELQYHGDGKEIDREPIASGDRILAFHEDGSDITIRIDICQEEGTLIGTVLTVDGTPPGIAPDDMVVFHEDFVFVVRKNN